MTGPYGKKLTPISTQGGLIIFRWIARTAAKVRCTAWTTYTVLVRRAFNDPEGGDSSHTEGASFNRPRSVQPTFGTMQAGFLDCWKHPPEERQK